MAKTEIQIEPWYRNQKSKWLRRWLKGCKHQHNRIRRRALKRELEDAPMRFTRGWSA